MDITLNADDEFDLTLDRGDDEAGTLTLEIVTDDGKVTINLGRFYDDLATTVGELKRCADKGEKMLADWEDRPDEYDAFVTEDRAAYYLKLEGTTSRNPRRGYPSRDIAEYELAAWMAESGVFPNAWFMNERGNVENISERIRKFHDAGGDKLLPLEGVEYAVDSDINAPYGGASVVMDYGKFGILYIYHGDDTVHFNEDREDISAWVEDEDGE